MDVSILSEFNRIFYDFSKKNRLSYEGGVGAEYFFLWIEIRLVIHLHYFILAKYEWTDINRSLFVFPIFVNNIMIVKYLKKKNSI